MSASGRPVIGGDPSDKNPGSDPLREWSMSEDGPRDRDRMCLRRLAEGDADALEPIWEAHADRTFRHALWVTGRPEDAEDVVQTVFVRLAGLGADLLGIRD